MRNTMADVSSKLYWTLMISFPLLYSMMIIRQIINQNIIGTSEPYTINLMMDISFMTVYMLCLLIPAALLHALRVITNAAESYNRYATQNRERQQQLQEGQ